MKRRDVFVRIATVTGWTLQQIGGLTMHQINDMFGYWSEHPPVHELVAHYMGVGRSRGPKVADASSMKAFIASAERSARV